MQVRSYSRASDTEVSISLSSRPSYLVQFRGSFVGGAVRNAAVIAMDIKGSCGAGGAEGYLRANAKGAMSTTAAIAV